MVPYTEDNIDPMVLLVKHEKASEAFGTDLFYTDEHMNFRVADDNHHIYLHVPRGYLTDGATVPESLQAWFPVWDSYYQAAVFHDYLCEYLTIYIDGVPTRITRTEADEYFNRIMKVLHVAPLKRVMVSTGVKVYSHVKSIVNPSATRHKRAYEDEIRKQMVIRDKAREDQKKKTA